MHARERKNSFSGALYGAGRGRLRHLAVDSVSVSQAGCYDEDTLTKISQALRALPADNVLRQAMEDYENERDDLRFCLQP